MAQNPYKAPTEGQPKPQGPAPFVSPRVKNGDKPVTPPPVASPPARPTRAVPPKGK